MRRRDRLPSADLVDGQSSEFRLALPDGSALEGPGERAQESSAEALLGPQTTAITIRLIQMRLASNHTSERRVALSMM